MKLGTRTMIMAATAAILAVAAGVVTVSLPRLVERRVTALRLDDRWAESIQLQGRLVTLFPRSDGARIAVQGSLSPLVAGDDELLITGSGWIASRGAGSVGTETIGPIVLAHVERIAARQRDPLWTLNLRERQAELLAALGRHAQARELMASIIDGFRDAGLAGRAVAARATLIGWTDGAAERLAAARETLALPGLRPFQTAAIHVLAADALAELGEYAQAGAHYRSAIEAETQNIAMADRGEGAPRAVLSGQPNYARAVFGLAFVDYLQNRDAQEAARVSGSLVIAGEPSGTATIYLTPSDDERRGVFGELLTEQSFTAQTAADGTFAFSDLPPGRYRLTLGVRHRDLVGVGIATIPDFVDLTAGATEELHLRLHPRVSISEPAGSVTLPAGTRIELPVTWEPMAEAESYAVELLHFYRDERGVIGGWSTQTVAERVRSTGVTVRLDGFELLATQGVSYGATLNPVSVIGPWYPDNPVGLRVRAFASDGSVISDSEGYLAEHGVNYPLITMGGDFADRFGAAADAARATARRDYDRAVSEWTRVLAASDADPVARATAALALARLFGYLRTEGYPDRATAERYYGELIGIAADAIDLPPSILAEAGADR